MSRVTPEMTAALTMARRHRGVISGDPLPWHAGPWKFDWPLVKRLIDAGLVEPMDHTERGYPRRVELNLRGQDLADEAIALAKGLSA